MPEEKGIPSSIKQMWTNFAKQTTNAVVKKNNKKEFKTLWDSSKKGTYVKKRHGQLK